MRCLIVKLETIECSPPSHSKTVGFLSQLAAELMLVYNVIVKITNKEIAETGLELTDNHIQYIHLYLYWCLFNLISRSVKTKNFIKAIPESNIECKKEL